MESEDREGCETISQSGRTLSPPPDEWGEVGVTAEGEHDMSVYRQEIKGLTDNIKDINSQVNAESTFKVLNKDFIN